MKKLIVLRGNSGSGKTTVAKELQKCLGRNTLLISQDVIRREMLYVKDGENTETLPLLKELLKYGNEHSKVVILEGILRTCIHKVCVWILEINSSQTRRFFAGRLTGLSVSLSGAARHLSPQGETPFKKNQRSMRRI